MPISPDPSATPAELAAPVPLVAIAARWADRLTEPWVPLTVVGVLIVLVAAWVVTQRIRKRQRRELFGQVLDALDPLLLTPTRDHRAQAGGERDDREQDAAETVRQAGTRTRETLAELERISRFETSAAALALRRYASELADTLESRLRGEQDPYRLDVHIAELRERVRGARDRLDAAIGA